LNEYKTSIHKKYRLRNRGAIQSKDSKTLKTTVVVFNVFLQKIIAPIIMLCVL
jgi:hypothetical protein